MASRKISIREQKRQPASLSLVPKQNQYFLGDTLAILLCPASNGKVFGVTIDREDLARVLDAGFWRIADFGQGRKLFTLYCYLSQKRIVYLHRFISQAPKELEVDHIHHRNLDNRKSQLRKVPAWLNQLNRKGHANKWGHRGVVRTRSGRFEAVVALGGRQHYLGRFDSPQEAGECVQRFVNEQIENYTKETL